MSTMGQTSLPHDHGNAKRAAPLMEKLSGTEDFSAAADCFALLGDSSRLKIFWLLCHCEECVINISAMTSMSSPAVSHHLRLLKDAELISSRREGREVYYRAADSARARALHQMAEKLMEISAVPPREDSLKAESFSPSQAETVRRMHDELLAHPEQRPTIEELARKYLMNPTTLKEVFKAVYGDSLAQHMKAHRLEKAAELLRCSEESIAAIARSCGYESPSRFSSAFRAHFHVLPAEYRKINK